MKRVPHESDEDINYLSELEDEPEVDPEEARIKFILDHANEAQLERYRIMHITSLHDPSGKGGQFDKLVSRMISAKPSDNLLTALAAAAKMHIGELVEHALEVAAERGQAGALQPEAIAAARQRVREAKTRV